MIPSLILPLALLVLTLIVLILFSAYHHDRRARLNTVYHRIGEIRRNNQPPADAFARDPESTRLRTFLHGYLQVPETVLGFNSQSGLTNSDLSRLVALWSALGDNAELCYGYIDEHKRHPLSAVSSRYASLWNEFEYLGERWVYWYGIDSTLVDLRRDFYRHDAAVIREGLRFGDVGDYLFKPETPPI